MEQLDRSNLAGEWLERLRGKSPGSRFESGVLILQLSHDRVIRLVVDSILLAGSARDLTLDGSWSAAKSPKDRLFTMLDNYWEDALLRLENDTEEIRFIDDGTFRGFYAV